MSIFDSFRQLPTVFIFLIITAKFLFGVGLGVLLAKQLKSYGWWLIIISIVIGLPGAYLLYFGKNGIFVG